MRSAWFRSTQVLARLWQGLREWCGDAAYETYRNCAVRTRQQRVLSPTEFYIEQLNKKYSRPTRCC